MADPVTYDPILIAGISAGSAIIGGLIIAGSNLLNERQRSKREAEKFKLEKEAHDLELCDQAYIEFLIFAMVPECNPYLYDLEFVMTEQALESIASVVTYGSPTIRGILIKVLPFEDWDEVSHLRRLILAELMARKGGMDTFTGGSEVVKRTGK